MSSSVVTNSAFQGLVTKTFSKNTYHIIVHHIIIHVLLQYEFLCTRKVMIQYLRNV
ncbi:hypothetical protein WN55_09625 [Dufourea novaeangliae]|uniref:Uncharacterized protein n=1 Tax=Dufourea novaeangliae TaxID=178035 RepID=A0A154NYS5_DUFNO|nr:hypothetical protein WN55_09625 [Dufourea novaeangliae]